MFIGAWMVNVITAGKRELATFRDRELHCLPSTIHNHGIQLHMQSLLKSTFSVSIFHTKSNNSSEDPTIWANKK